MDNTNSKTRGDVADGDRCPHCGTKLPVLRDAFCPECRNDLADPPASAVASDPHAAPGEPGDAGRPPGVSILAVLFATGGVSLLFFAARGYLAKPGGSPLPILVSLAAAPLLVVAARGLWRGRKWAWWIAALYYAYSIDRNAAALLALAVDDVPRTAEYSSAYYATKYASRIIIQGVLLLYLFRARVLRYFCLEGTVTPRVRGVFVVIWVFLTLVAYALGGLMR